MLTSHQTLINYQRDTKYLSAGTMKYYFKTNRKRKIKLKLLFNISKKKNSQKGVTPCIDQQAHGIHKGGPPPSNRASYVNYQISALEFRVFYLPHFNRKQRWNLNKHLHQMPAESSSDEIRRTPRQNTLNLSI